MEKTKQFYIRQIGRIKKRLDVQFSDDDNKTQHYFQQKGFYEGLLYAYENFIDNMEQ